MEIICSTSHEEDEQKKKEKIKHEKKENKDEDENEGQPMEETSSPLRTNRTTTDQMSMMKHKGLSHVRAAARDARRARRRDDGPMRARRPRPGHVPRRRRDKTPLARLRGGVCFGQRLPHR